MKKQSLDFKNTENIKRRFQNTLAQSWTTKFMVPSVWDHTRETICITELIPRLTYDISKSETFPTIISQHVPQVSVTYIEL